MTNQAKAEGGNPKQDQTQADGGNAKKDRADWVTGDEPMTGAQAS